MADKLEYKEFLGSVSFSAEDQVFHGKIEGIEDLITFEGETVSELESSFKKAVDGYIELCERVGKEYKSTYVKSLVDFFQTSPLYDTEMDLTRTPDFGRDVEI